MARRLPGTARQRDSSAVRLRFDPREPAALFAALVPELLERGRPRVLLHGGSPGDRLFVAHRLAAELERPVAEVRVVRWLGASTKKLASVLERARRRRALLLFDEADALFTKRGEVRRPGTKRGTNAALCLRALERTRRPLVLSITSRPGVLELFERRVDVIVTFGRTAQEDGVPGRLRTTQHFRVRLECAGRPAEELACCRVGPLTTESAVSEKDPDGPLEHRPPRVVLRRALDRSRSLFAWRQEVLDGEPGQRDVHVELLDRAGGDTLTTWTLRDARPLRWSGPTLDALESTLATEELELTYRRLEWPTAN